MTGKKFDGGKPTPQYIDPVFQLEVGAGMGFGEVKYGPWNFVGGMRWTRLIGGIMRHLIKFAVGIEYDKESGISHLALAGCGLNMLYTHWRAKLGKDDRLNVPGTEEHIDRIYDNLDRRIGEWREKKAAAQEEMQNRFHGRDSQNFPIRPVKEKSDGPISL